MKNNYETILSAMRGIAACALAVCATMCFTACSSDDEDPITPTPQIFNGQLTTTLPSMPTFEALTNANTVVVTWGNPEQTMASVKLGAFTIEVNTPMGTKSYEIGEMTITNVACEKVGDEITMSQPEFQCMAGDFDTKGSLVGTLENGKLSFTLLYKPGSMPFDVQSVFEGK